MVWKNWRSVCACVNQVQNEVETHVLQYNRTQKSLLIMRMPWRLELDRDVDIFGIGHSCFRECLD